MTNILCYYVFGGHFGNNTFLGIFTKTLYNNYLLDDIPPKPNYFEHLLLPGSVPQQDNCFGMRGFFNDNCGVYCFE